MPTNPTQADEALERVADAVRDVLGRIGFMDPEWGGSEDDCRMVARAAIAALPKATPGSEDGLLPCPFCGGPAELVVRDYTDDCANFGNSYGSCLQCGVEQPFKLTKELAIEAWNTRALTPSTPSVKPGYVAVPVEPTEEMMLAAAEAHYAGVKEAKKARENLGLDSFNTSFPVSWLDRIYRAMLSAAPSVKPGYVAMPVEIPSAVHDAILKYRDSGCSVRNLYDEIIRAALLSTAPSSGASEPAPCLSCEYDVCDVHNCTTQPGSDATQAGGER